MRRVILFFAMGAGSGYVPVASGTAGTALAIPLFFAFHHLRELSLVLYLLAFLAAVGASCWIADRADEMLGEHDSPKIVIDEIVGYLAATLFLEPTWGNAFAAFFVFRVFDVIKPFPAGYIDANLSGGRGVVLDDVVSGLYSRLALAIVALVWP